VTSPPEAASGAGVASPDEMINATDPRTMVPATTVRRPIGSDRNAHPRNTATTGFT